ncbi:hypothetical protein [Lyngbya sp. CCY1209]|uniref:hypothetical protein n=1 Tax=Lyngbya sp. CCY1209 TaxID=2886103 RepID=UPI002D209D1C|nr:hypothetical protein [Lyngbya sp. CCY1209]MEB3884365.1 hypothetical protein [Lyngbya sp. CCY1209]
MLESLPDEVQDRVVDHLREYIDDLQDELKWDRSFERSQSQLIAAIRKAKRETTEGKTTAMDYDRLRVWQGALMKCQHPDPN